MAKLSFRHAAMNAGKSTSLLQVAHNYEEQGRKVALYTAAIDDRHGVGRITSRLGIQRDANVYTAETNFEKLLVKEENLSCVLVDEAQFLSAAQVRQLHRYVHLQGIPVICFGLRSDFKGNAFRGAAELLALADDLQELRTICSCGRKATMNVRVDEHGKRVKKGNQVDIGGNSRYRQACAECFYKGI